MSANEYLIWFIATTVMVAGVIAFGTFAATGGLERRRERHGVPERQEERPEAGETGAPEPRTEVRAEPRHRHGRHAA